MTRARGPRLPSGEVVERFRRYHWADGMALSQAAAYIAAYADALDAANERAEAAEGERDRLRDRAEAAAAQERAAVCAAIWNRILGRKQMGRDAFWVAGEVKDEIDGVFNERSALAAEEKDGAYRERDRLVAVLSTVWPSHLRRHVGEWEDDWRNIVCVHTPNGQATWHVHDSEMPLFDHLTYCAACQWDGHTTEEKYARLAALAAETGGGDE